MSKFWRKLCCCGVKASSPDRESSISRPSRNRSQNNLDTSTTDRQHHVRASVEVRVNPKPQKKLLKLKSNYAKEDLRWTDTRSEETKDLKFNCPICFRYFNQIMVSTCCKNYMCHFCASDMNDKIKKEDKAAVARCSFCSSEDFELHDVDSNEKPKKYTDSFYSTIKSNGKDGFANKLFGMTRNKDNEHEHENEHEQEQDQFYNSNMQVDLSPERLHIKDKRAASDGIKYMQQEIVERKMSKTFTEESRARDNFMNEIGNVLHEPHIHEDALRVSRDNTDERRPHDLNRSGSDSSINERVPIDIIEEDEFESSVVPELEQFDQFGNRVC